MVIIKILGPPSLSPPVWVPLVMGRLEKMEREREQNNILAAN